MSVNMSKAGFISLLPLLVLETCLCCFWIFLYRLQKADHFFHKEVVINYCSPQKNRVNQNE